MGRYDDIIHLTHPTSRKHPRMAMEDRAAQFSPFAALTGHDAAIKETARLTTERLETDEDIRASLDWKYQLLKEELIKHPEVTVTYFVPDTKKTGGSYERITGYLKKLDEYERVMILEDGTRIPMKDVVELEEQ